MMNEHPGERRLTPGETAESEELEMFERNAAERGPPSKAASQGDQDDPREEDGWTQPESSAQKGAMRDEG
jgi:hypothetical protein